MRIDDLRIAYIGGGSRGWAYTFMTDIALESRMGGTIALYDLDLKSAQENAKIGNDLSLRPEAVGKWRYEVCSTLKETLSGADFILISIMPGTMDEMTSDVHAPEKYGIYQSVGDTTGPGGLIRALRTIPIYTGFAEAIAQYAPKAWVINYTNPMALCVRALYEAFPDVKAVGCCHEVFSTQQLLSHALEEILEVPRPRREELDVNVWGVNHFTWFDSAFWNGYDIMPVYRQFVDRYYETGFNEPNQNWMNSHFDCAHKVKFDLFRTYGFIAAAGDRHLAEFMPGDRYLADPDVVKKYMFNLTPVSWRKQDLVGRRERSRRLVEHREKLELVPSGEEGSRIIAALCGLERFVTNVNYPNFSGQIANLDHRSVVETNVVIGGDSVRPVYAGKIPGNLEDLFDRHITNQGLIMEAALSCTRDKALAAFMSDPLICGRLREDDGHQLFDQMLASTAAYLPPGWGF